ncbi:MAG: hypothetical protein HN875_01485 [Candidatus Nitrosopelagicus sp.]|nr:hypothetical protein [Candidatus Nitrosopelagicus sp.]
MTKKLKDKKEKSKKEDKDDSLEKSLWEAAEQLRGTVEVSNPLNNSSFAYIKK